MSYHEKKSIVSMVSALVIFMIYFIVVFHKYQAGNLDSTNVFSFWGSVILILIPASIMAKIIIYIIFCIIYRMTTNEDAPSFSDERDKLIELKAERNSHWVFCLGFLLAMASQVMHMAPSVMFIVLILAGFVSDIFGEVSQLYFYRRGV